jgi:hypothetical protein
MLLRKHGDDVVTLSSSNSISHEKTRTTLSSYIDMMTSTIPGQRSNETFYLFGPHAELSSKLQSLVKEYRRPAFAGSDLAFSFGIGAAGSGVPFHIHGHGFTEVIHGAKVCISCSLHACAVGFQYANIV